MWPDRDWVDRTGELVYPPSTRTHAEARDTSVGIPLSLASIVVEEEENGESKVECLIYFPRLCAGFFDATAP